MKMTIGLFTGLLTLWVLWGIEANLAWGQEEGPEVNISEVSCRDMLKMAGDERDYSLVFFHGYVQGKQETEIFSETQLSQATDQIVDYCIDNPSDSLMEVFEETLSTSSN